ncbi:MAG: DUF2142 domain-containing protein [Lachnospiraceae bacterium]|nr:DUF2142 domain-containing protein [Lachnospiraceae bacterium]
MKKILNQISRYFLPVVTVGLVLLLVLSWLFPNRVLDTYEMNISGNEEEETIIPLPEGSVISYTMNTGTRPLRGIQPGISLRGGRFVNGQLRCRVYREPSHELVSDNTYSLAELTQSIQSSIDGGADSSLAWQALYTYIPFADYERCSGDIMLVFSYESMGDVPEQFAVAEEPDGQQGQDEARVPGLSVNETRKENTLTCVNGEEIEGGLCGYSVYTHNTYPLIYDLRLLICIFLAASVSVQPVFAKYRTQSIKDRVCEAVRRLGTVCGSLLKHIRERWKRGLAGAGFVLAAAVCSVALEAFVWNGHVLGKTQYRSNLLQEAGVEATLQTGNGREKLTREEENTVLRNRENAKILAELNGTEYIPPEEENLVEEEDGLYRRVKRTNLKLVLSPARYIHTLTLKVPETEEGNTVTIQADGEEVVSDAWLDERIGQGSYVLDRECGILEMEITGTESLGEAVEVTAANEFTLNPVRMLFLFSVFLLAGLFIRGRKLFAERPEAVFALCSLVMGSLLIYSVGLNQVGYDEHIHMKTAYERSFGSTVLTTESAMQMEASTMPSFQNLEERRMVETYAEQNDDFSWANITHQSRFPGYEVRSYLQISVFMWLARAWKLPFVWCMMLGKFGNLLLYTVVCYFAVKAAKQGKVLVAALALIPNCIFAAASFSYDAVVNSFLLLALVLTLNQIGEEKRISWLQTIVLLGAFLAGSTAKAIYILMAFLLLLFPKEKFGSRWKELVYKLCTTAVMLLLIYTFFFPPVSASANYEVMGNLAYAGDKRSQGTNVLGQISYILQHPVTYAGLLIRSMLGELWNYLSGAKQFIAYGYLGGIRTIWTWAGLLALFSAAVFAPEGEERKALLMRFKIGNGLVILGMSAVIWTSMYVTFTAVGADVINGVQGRYFLPLFLLFFSCFYQNKRHVKLDRAMYAKGILAVFTVMNLYGIWVLSIAACNR